MSFSSSLLSKEERDFYEVKHAAAEYFRSNGTPEKIEEALNQLLEHQPDDIHAYLADYFRKLCAPPRISRLKGREVFDASGQLSIEAEVFCIVCSKEESLSSASISSHFGQDRTAVFQRADMEERAQHVTTALHWINEHLNKMLKDLNPCNQSEIDHMLSEFFKARSLEDKGRSRKRQEKDASASEPDVVRPSSPPPPLQPNQAKQKKGAGKKCSVVEKPIPPAKPPEPVLPGSLAVGSVSLAVAKTGAQIQGVPLYKYILALKNPAAQTQLHVPFPLVTLLSCGKSSPGKLNLLQEVLLIPKPGRRVKQIITMTLELQREMMRIMNASTKAVAPQATLCDGGAPTMNYERPEQPLDLVTEACDSLQMTLGVDINLALNCAASELMDYSKGKYEISTGVFKSPDELVETYHTLITKYPAIGALIDPLRKEDTEQWEKLSDELGDACLLLSEVTHKPKAPPLPGVSSHVQKYVNETTVSDLIRIAADQQGAIVMGAECSEPTDDALSDMVRHVKVLTDQDDQCTVGSGTGLNERPSREAVGLGLDYVKLGGLSGAERVTKYNRLISIEEELAQQGILVSKAKRHPALFRDITIGASSE